MGYREFPVHIPTDDDEGPEFALGERRFRCLPVLPAGAIAEMPLAWPVDRAPSDIMVTRAVLFLTRCIRPDQQDALADALRDPRAVVAGETAVEIARWLVGEYSPFVQRRPDGSSDGPSTTGPTSSAASSPMVASGAPSAT